MSASNSAQQRPPPAAYTHGLPCSLCLIDGQQLTSPKMPQWGCPRGEIPLSHSCPFPLTSCLWTLGSHLVALFWEVASSWKKLVTGAEFLEAYCPLLLLVLTLLPCMQRCETLQLHSHSDRYGCCGLILHLSSRHHELCPLIETLFKVNLSSFQSLLWGVLP